MQSFSKLALILLFAAAMPVSANLIAGTNSEKISLKTKEATAVDSIKPVLIRKSFIPERSGENTSNLLNPSSLSTSAVPVSASIGVSNQGRIIEAYYFPGISARRAIVIGGMHGSELSSVALARQLIKELMTGRKIYYSVIVIPSLFPDNAHAAMSKPELLETVHNIGRYSYRNAADPNRQMPRIGEWHDDEEMLDHMGRKIEHENRLLLNLIKEFRPDRIANLHAIRDTLHAGIFADPRTSSKGIALGFESDSAIAVQMATLIHMNGGNADGNRISVKPTALYHRDPPVAAKGNRQSRTFCGAKLPENRGAGVSLGTWASTAVEDLRRPENSRPAIRLFTVEFPGYRPPTFYHLPLQRTRAEKNIQLYAESILNIFLQEYFVEM